MATLAPPLKNAAYLFDLDVFDNSGKYLTGATFSSYQISKDGGSFATLTNAPAEISTLGVYVISLTSTEMNADRVHMRFVISGAQDIGVSLVTVARQFNDLAFPLTSGRGQDVNASGKVILQPAQPGVTIPLVTTTTTLTNDPTGVTTLLSLLTSARAGYLDLLNSYLDSSVAAVATLVGLVKVKTDNLPSDPADESLLENAITVAQNAILVDTALIKAKTTNLPASPAAVGSQMDLVNAPNATAVTAIQSGLATAANLTTVLNRLGAFSGSGLNTVLGFLRALGRSDAALTPSDMAGTFDNTTDSQQALRDRGDAAWTTFGGGSAPTAVQIADEVQTRTIAGVTAVNHVTGAVGSVTGNVGGNVNGNLVGNVQGTVPDSAGVATLLARLSPTVVGYLNALAGFSGTLVAALQAMARKDAAASPDLGGTFTPTTDSQEALREKVDTLAPNTPVTTNVTVNES